MISLRRFIYQPPRPAVRPRGVPLLEIDGAAAIDSGPVGVDDPAHAIVYLHGNAADLSLLNPLYGFFVTNRVRFAAVEYPGYGVLSADAASEKSIFASVDTMLRELRERRGITHLTLVGESLGSAIAAEMAVRGLAERLVLLSAFTSMVDVIKGVVALTPAVAVPDRYDTRQRASKISIPTLLIHGSADTLVPPAMSEELAAVIGDSRRLVMQGRDHNGLWINPSQTAREVLAFARS